MIGFKVLVTAGLLLIGGLLVLNQQMNIGQFVAAEIIILLVITSVEKMILGLETFYDLLTSLEKLGQVVDKEIESQDGEKPFHEGEVFTVEVADVSFEVSGEDNKIIDNVSLTISSESNILIHGPIGAGKSTLLKLITGILEPTRGNIFINKVPLKNLNLNYYRSFLGQSLSEESPFEGSILNNITLGDTSIGIEQVYWALEKIKLIDFVKKQPKGLKTMLYPEGKNIPFTVAKKIVLARSIVRKPKMLVLKDPLDQLHQDEMDEIMRFLADSSNGWSLVIVSENLKWMSYCKRIIAMEKGRIINEKTNGDA